MSIEFSPEEDRSGNLKSELEGIFHTRINGLADTMFNDIKERLVDAVKMGSRRIKYRVPEVYEDAIPKVTERLQSEGLTVTSHRYQYNNHLTIKGWADDN